MKFEKMNLDLFKQNEVDQSNKVKGGAGPIEVDTYIITSNRSGSDETRGDGVECDEIYLD